MWLVLCPSTDASVLWAFQGLKTRGLTPLEWVSPEHLARGLRWEHRLGAKGVSIEIILADGRTIRNQDIRGTLNRLVSVPFEALHSAHPVDREYASQELTAFFLSWLYALPSPVVNWPTPRGLSGAWRHRSEWVWLASKAGLPTPVFKQTSCNARDEQEWQGRLVPPDALVETVLVLADQVIGAPLPPELQEGCRRLATLAETALIGIELAVDPAGRWTFVGATPLPDLRLGGEALLDTLTSVLLGYQKVRL